MTRKLMTVLCLVLLAAVVAGWVRSFMASDALTLPVAGSQIGLRHMRGNFTIAWADLGMLLAMPYWLAVMALAAWPLLHLRVSLADTKKPKGRR